MRYIYWDKVMIVDNEFDKNLLKKLHKISETKGFTKAGIEDVGENTSTLNTTDSNYYQKPLPNKIQKLVENEIDNLGILPIDKKYRVAFHPRFHKMKKGGNLARHTDSGHSIGISLYFNECLGGEFKFENGDGQNLLIEPKSNRLVMIKGDNPHQVNTVIEGIRNSLQIFVAYKTDENRSST